MFRQIYIAVSFIHQERCLEMFISTDENKIWNEIFVFMNICIFTLHFKAALKALLEIKYVNKDSEKFMLSGSQWKQASWHSCSITACRKRDSTSQRVPLNNNSKLFSLDFEASSRKFFSSFSFNFQAKLLLLRRGSFPHRVWLSEQLKLFLFAFPLASEHFPRSCITTRAASQALPPAKRH